MPVASRSDAAVDEVQVVPALPRQLQLEVTGACNLSCAMCLVRYRPPLNRTEGSMSFETFTALLDAVPDLEVLTLQGLGEPLLAPDLFRMVDLATSRGIRTGFNTNGMLLSPERAERLVRAGLAWLHVSLDGSTAATYEGIRAGGRFDRVCRNLRSLVEVKDRLGADNPHVEIVFVAMRRNIAELPGLVRLAAGLGVSAVRVQNLSHSFSDTDPAGSYAAIRAFAAAEALWQEPDPEAERVLDEARGLAASVGIDLRLPHLTERPRPRRPGTPACGWPWDSAYVTHDAKVQPCCMIMGSDRSVLGDLGEQRFGEIWAGGAYRAFREGLLTDEPPDVCRGCSLYRRVF